MTRLKLAGATVNQIPLDWNNNLSNIREAIREARRVGVSILCLPELCITGYGCEDAFLSDWVSATAWDKLNTLIPECENIVVCVGLPLRIYGKTYNGACVIKNKRVLGITLKQNLANEGVHYEPRWFVPWTPGKVITLTFGQDQVQVGDLVYETDGIRFGFEICEDAWSKNRRPGHRLKDRGVHLILNPSASHFALGKASAREKEVIIDGSASFDCLYLFVNHLGNEAGRMIYDGDIVFGQQGELLAANTRLSFRPWNLLAITVDTEGKEKSERREITDGRERNEEFARAAALALFDYLRKSRSQGFVLSLSGGADSSTCAVLVAEMIRRASAELGWPAFWKALGRPENSPTSVEAAAAKLLTCAYQSTRNSTPTTQDAAQRLAESIGAAFHTWSIDEETSSYTTKLEAAIGRTLSWETDDITLQNIQARSRSPIIWMLANLTRSLLLTTSNRSEGDVGYATMDGDTSGSLAPLAGIDKPFLLQWLAWAEVHLGYSGLQAVNRLTPTAELRPAERAQSDEKDLMPYPVLASIERLAIFHRLPPAAVFEELKGKHDPQQLKAWIRTFFRMWSANQWKRERLAPSFHFDDFNIDPRSGCRFPILSGGFREELDRL